MPFRSDVTVNSDKGLAVLRVTGDLDFDDRNELRQVLGELLQAAQPRLVVDLSSISRMSSIYLGILLDAGAQAKERGRVLAAVLSGRLAALSREAGLEATVQVLVAPEAK